MFYVIAVHEGLITKLGEGKNTFWLIGASEDAYFYVYFTINLDN